MISNEPPVLLGRDTAEPLIVPRALLRKAAAEADLAEATCLRIFAGFPSRAGTRDRLVAALTRIGAPGAANLLASAETVATGKRAPAEMTMKHTPGDDATPENADDDTSPTD